MALFGPDLPSLRTSPASTGPIKGRTSGRSSTRSSTLRNHTFMLLDLTPGGGNMLGPCWEYDPPWLGPPGTLNTSECPSGGADVSLSQILQAEVPSKYSLSKKACLGILRRARRRGKPLPRLLELALRMQAGIPVTEAMEQPPPLAFHINQRDEAIDLEGVAGALMAICNMQMQAFITRPASMRSAGFCAGAGSSAGSIGYQVEAAPTLKGTPGGNMTPSVLCLNDQGGDIMACSGDISGTLRAQEHGHQPLIFENHGVDARYRGPLSVSPTLPARMGTGGNNTSLILDVAGLDCRNGQENGDLSGTLQTGTALNSLHPVRVGWLIRRLTPTEAERLQGYPDDWTNISGASDSARYRALGNSVAIPCVERIMRGVAVILGRR